MLRRRHCIRVSDQSECSFQPDTHRIRSGRNIRIRNPRPTFKLDRDAGPVGFRSVSPGQIERPTMGGNSFQVDEFDRLWFADTGTVNQFELDARPVCPPKLLIYDLKNNKKISELRPSRCRRAQTRRVFVCNGVTARLYIIPQDRTRSRRRISNRIRC